MTLRTGEIIQPGLDPGIYGLKNARWTNLSLGGEDHSDIGGQSLNHLETLDFPTTDPWSRHLRRVIGELRDERAFGGKFVTEFGIGDGRNIFAAGSDITGVLGIDIDENRLRIAEMNFRLRDEYRHIRRELVQADAAEIIDRWKTERPELKLRGWGIICLPQSRQGENTADMYDPNVQRLAPYKENWDRYGLTLNAAVLDKLRDIAAVDFRALIVNSDRVPFKVREAVLHWAGWDIKNEYISPPIQHDPDTGVGWMVEAGIDDGKRFYEKTRTGLLRPISVIEAETRRLESVRTGQGRDGLNVYHNLSVYEIVPGEKRKWELAA